MDGDETTQGPPSQASRERRRLTEVVLPHTGGHLADSLAGIDRLLAFLATFQDPTRREGIAEVVRRYYRGEQDQEPARGPLPGVLGNGRRLAARRRLIAEVSIADRRRPAALPIAADAYELVPLVFHDLPETDLAAFVEALALIASTDTSREVPLSAAVRAFTLDEKQFAFWVRESGRLLGLFTLPCDEASAVVRRTLDIASSGTSRIVLNQLQQAAYEKVTARIVGTWHEGDKLEALLYRR